MEKIKIKRLNFRKIFYNNKFVLFFSVLVALIIWVILSLSSTDAHPVDISDIPINVNLSSSAKQDGLRVFGLEKLTATVSVTGSRFVVGQLTKDDIEITALQAENITTPGNYPLRLTAKKVGVLNNYDISSSISPDIVTVMVDKYREVEFDIENKISYTADPAYFSSSINLSSPKVILSGPESEISRVKKVAVQDDVQGVLSESKVINNLPVIMYNSYDEVMTSDLITMSVTNVDVTIPILLKKTMPIEAQFINGPAELPFSKDDIKIEPNEIEVAGPENTINASNSIKLTPIDFSEINLENNEFEQTLELPIGFKSLNNIYSCKVKINMDSISYKTVTVSNFSIENQPPGKNSVINTKSVDVLVFGLKNQISLINENNILGIVDLKDKESFVGNTEIPLSFKINDYTYCWVYGSYNANVEVNQI